MQTINCNKVSILELDQYIGNTHHRGRLWDNRNHRNIGKWWQSVTSSCRCFTMMLLT